MLPVVSMLFEPNAGGHVISAAVGAAFRLALKDALWIAAPVAMALALIAMQLTRTTHPPGALTHNTSFITDLRTCHPAHAVTWILKW